MLSDNNEQKIIINQNIYRNFIKECLKYLLRPYFILIYIKTIDEIKIVKSGIKGPVNNEIGKIITRINKIFTINLSYLLTILFELSNSKIFILTFISIFIEYKFVYMI